MFNENLRTIILSNNQIKVIGNGMFELRLLSKINLSNNVLSEDSFNTKLFGQLENLSELILSKNKFKEIPESLVKCPLLEKLDFSNNSITIIKSFVGKMASLKFLLLGFNFVST